MAIETTYSQARENLASLMDRVTDHLEVVIISRRKGKRVALVDAAEYEGLLETAHLLRSPRNADGSCSPSTKPAVGRASR